MKRFFSLLGLSLATFLIVLDYTIANVSIPYIAGDLSVSSDQGTYVITSFAVGNAIVLPISGWLTQRIGGVKLLINSILLFVFFSWTCAIAESFSFLIISRFLQGFVAGPLVPLSQSLIVSTSPPEKKNAVLAFWSAIVIAAPVIGPLLGGWLSFDYSWPWIFYINIPFGIFSALCIRFTLKKENTSPSKTPIDYIGFFLLSIGVTCLQIILDKGEQFDWLNSKIIITLAITCTVSFGYFILWELMHPYPLVNFSLLKIKSYSTSILFIATMYSMYFGSVVLVPLWLQTNMGYNSIWAGIAVAPIGLAPLLFAFYIGKLITRYGLIKPLFFCFIIFSLSCFYAAYFNTQVAIKQIWISRILMGCGLTLFITPLFALSVQDIEISKLPQATGLFHFIRVLSGGFGTSIFTTLWIRRTAYHHERIGETITVGSQETKSFFNLVESLNIAGKKALSLLNTLVDNQAAMMALNDCFYLMGGVFLLLILLLPLGRKKQSEKNKPEEGKTSPGNIIQPQE